MLDVPPPTPCVYGNLTRHAEVVRDRRAYDHAEHGHRAVAAALACEDELAQRAAAALERAEKVYARLLGPEHERTQSAGDELQRLRRANGA